MQDTASLVESVRAALDTQVRPLLQEDGGDVELVGVSPEGDVFMRLVGSCRGCPISALRVKVGVEAALRQLVPGVRRVLAVDAPPTAG